MTSFTKAFITVSLLLSGCHLGVESFAPASTTRPFYRHLNIADNAEGASHMQTAPTSGGHRSISTSRRYSESVSHPIPQDKSFEERMRKLVQKKPAVQRRKNPMRPDNVLEVLTLEEYKNAVADVKDKLVVVRFYAKWCRACRAVAPSFYKMAKDFADEAVFVELPVTQDNANVHQGLGVPSIPFGHIYHPEGGLVEELRLVRTEFPRFHKVFRSYVSGSCEVEDGDCASPY